MRPSRFLPFFIASAGLSVGCSLVNSFDEVKAKIAADTGVLQDTTVEDTVVDDTATTDTAQAPDTAVADTAVADMGTDTGPVEQGLIVLSARDPSGDAGVSGTYILTVLDPLTGKRVGTLANDEKLAVMSIKYDELRDLWYVLVNKGQNRVDPAPTDKTELQVRTYDRAAKKWTTISTLEIPPMFDDATVGVIGNGIAYLTAAVVDGGTELRLQVIDIAAPNMPKVGGTVSLPAIGTSVAGLIATRAPSNGGTVNVAFTRNCTGSTLADVCEVAFQRVTVSVGFTPTAGATTKVADTPPSPTHGIVAFGSFINGGGAQTQDVIVEPPTGAATKATLSRRNPQTNGVASGTSPIPFTPGIDLGTTLPSKRYPGLAVAECQKIVFVTDQLGQTVTAVPLDITGTPTPYSVGRPAQRVYFEPYTKSVLTPYGVSTNGEFQAITLSGEDKNPILKARAAASWSPPVGKATAGEGLIPFVIGVKTKLCE